MSSGAGDAAGAYAAPLEGLGCEDVLARAERILGTRAEREFTTEDAEDAESRKREKREPTRRNGGDGGSRRRSGEGRGAAGAGSGGGAHRDCDVIR